MTCTLAVNLHVILYVNFNLRHSNERVMRVL